MSNLPLCHVNSEFVGFCGKYIVNIENGIVVPEKNKKSEYHEELGNQRNKID